MHMRNLIKSILNVFGIQKIETTNDALTAYERLKHSEYDIVIIDWMVEPVNGLAFTKKVRTDKRSPDPYIPIILMTGYSEISRVKTARDSGITEFLAKPFTSRTLFARIQHIIEKPRRFVLCRSYSGPDRRRHKNQNYKGSEKRAKNKLLSKEKEQVYI